MKKTKWMALVLVCVMCLSLFVGCKETQEPHGTTTVPPTTQAPTTEPATEPTTEPTTAPTEPPVDAQTLLDVLRADKEGFSTSDQTTILDIRMKAAGLGVSMDISLDVEALAQWDHAQKMGYEEQTISVTMYGQTISQSMEVYSYELEDGRESYVYNVDGDVWSRSVSHPESISDNVVDSTAVMREETELYNDMECYVLETELSGDLFTNLLGSVTSVLGMPEPEEPDMSGVKGYMVAYVEKDTMLLRGYSVTAEGLEEPLTAAMNAAYEEMEMENSVSVSINELSIVTAKIDYEPVEIPILDEEIKAKAMDTTIEPDQGDGSYILQEVGEAVRITPPSGWEVYDVGHYYLVLDFDEDTVAYCYMYSDGDSLEENVQYYAEYFETNYNVDMKISEGKKIGDYETMICRGGGLYAYLTQIQVGDAYLLIEVENYGDLSPYVFLQGLVEGVEIIDLASVG